MNFRQIHLDCHTSECLEQIGEAFSKEQFQAALKKGHVNSITVFSKCHHGWAYHPSKANEMHPHLSFDLLGAQIEAAHEIGVKTPVYLSVGFDEKIARKYPQWLLRSRDERLNGGDFTHPGYHVFCLNSPYLEVMLSQIEEVVQNYDADGIFLDIVAVRKCYCQNCIQTLRDEGKDPYDEDNLQELAERVYANYTKRVRESIDKYKPGLPVFHNGGHIRRGRRDLAEKDSHFELESLPTGGWGYDHFPLSAAYTRTLGKEFLGMTGKFHTTWGEFGGFKHPNALRYEAALSVANGAKCSIGDQMHPSGALEDATYQLIGEAYAEIEAKEPWLDHVTSLADIAILSQEAVSNYYEQKGIAMNGTTNGDIGAVRTMLEGKYLFDIVDTEGDLSPYKLLILPDTIRLDKPLQEKINLFLKNGGKLLATGTSGLDSAKNEFVFDFGATFLGDCAFQPVYLRPAFELDCLANAAFVIYSQSYEIAAKEGVTPIAWKENPYFNRTVFQFSSHQHTPNNSDSKKESITQGKDGIYICCNLFEEYATKGNLPAKKILLHVIDLLLGEAKTITTNLPVQGIVTLMEQPSENRYINHVLYASPVKRGSGIEIIEDVLPVYQVSVSLNLPKLAKKVSLAPQNTPLPFSTSNGKIEYTIPELNIHQMVVIDY